MKTNNEKECTLSDEELAEACRKLVHDLCQTGGQRWRMSVPVDFNNDSDMLFCELINRFKEASQFKQSNPEGEGSNKELSELIHMAHEHMEGRYDLDGYDLGNIQHYLCLLQGKFPQKSTQQHEHELREAFEAGYRRMGWEEGITWATSPKNKEEPEFDEWLSRRSSPPKSEQPQERHP